MNRPPVVKKLCILPVDLHDWLTEQGAADLAPTNSVIVAICRKAMLEQKGALAGRKTEAA